ncbi:hypothetical protein J6590_040689, partial [Homalodisca vitripennis]
PRGQRQSGPRLADRHAGPQIVTDNYVAAAGESGRGAECQRSRHFHCIIRKPHCVMKNTLASRKLCNELEACKEASRV